LVDGGSFGTDLYPVDKPTQLFPAFLNPVLCEDQVFGADRVQHVCLVREMFTGFVVPL
jgi:hypothetical protein